MLRRFLCLLDEPMKQHHGAFGEPKEHPGVRPPGKSLRSSQSPSPSDRHTGRPMGHPNSTFWMSLPMAFRSSKESVFSQVRTGSSPLSVAKNRAGIFFSGFIRSYCAPFLVRRQASRSPHVTMTRSVCRPSWNWTTRRARMCRRPARRNHGKTA